MRLGERAVLSRLAAILLLGVVLAVFAAGPVAAYLGWLDGQGEALRHDREVLQRYRLLAHPLPLQPGAPADDRGLLFPAIPEAQAVALLQEALKGAAAAARVEIQGFQVLRSETAAGAVRIGVRLRASGDIAGLEHLLYTIENARPVLYPDNLDIRSTAARAGTQPAALEFQFDVSGFTTSPAT